MTKRVRANVYMRLSVEVDVGCWDGKSSFEELYQLAQREAENSVRHHLKNTNIRLVDPHKGEMKVHVVEGN